MIEHGVSWTWMVYSLVGCVCAAWGAWMMQPAYAAWGRSHRAWVHSVWLGAACCVVAVAWWAGHLETWHTWRHTAQQVERMQAHFQASPEAKQRFLEQATERLSDRVARVPHDQKASLLLAKLHMAQGHFQEAVAIHQALWPRTQSDPEAVASYLQALWSLHGTLPAALRDVLAYAAVHYPNHPRILTIRAWDATQRQAWDEAAWCWRQLYPLVETSQTARMVQQHIQWLERKQGGLE